VPEKYLEENNNLGLFRNFETTKKVVLPTEYLTKFQDPATAAMVGIYNFNYHLLFVALAIVILVGWLLYAILKNFTELRQNKVFNFVHSNLIEIVWTTVPALVLLSLASPSFSLLYSLDEISSPKLSLKIIGHQWYWSYETSDVGFCSNNGNNSPLKYASYLVPEKYLEENNNLGLFRNFETTKKVVLPIKTHVRLLTTSADVLHSWTIPSFGLKIDACPGRLNQTYLYIKRVGVFFGQCSEICGVNHGFMPVAVIAVSSEQYSTFLMEQTPDPNSVPAPKKKKLSIEEIMQIFKEVGVVDLKDSDKDKEVGVGLKDSENTNEKKSS
jgi:cytochrome c oxidase subunit 2